MARNCKECGALIEFYKTPSGKWMVVNARSLGKKIAIFGGVAHVVDVYENHWTTCTKPDLFRKKSKGGKP